jgi:hypothetical protein
MIKKISIVNKVTKIWQLLIIKNLSI